MAYHVFGCALCVGIVFPQVANVDTGQAPQYLTDSVSTVFASASRYRLRSSESEDVRLRTRLVDYKVTGEWWGFVCLDQLRGTVYTVRPAKCYRHRNV